MANYDNQFFQSSMSNLQGSVGDFISGDSPQSKIIPKTITENGTYDASADNADGYSSVTVDVAGGGGGETFEVEIEVILTDTAPITTVNKTYQQIKSEIDLGKTISGTLRVTYNSLVSSGELSISYVKDFYYATKIASDAIFIVTEPFLLNMTSEAKMNFIIPVVITPDNKVWLTMTDDWVSNPET